MVGHCITLNTPFSLCNLISLSIQSEKSSAQHDTVVSVISPYPDNTTPVSDPHTKTNPAFVDDLDLNSDLDMKKVKIELVNSNSNQNQDIEAKKGAVNVGQNGRVVVNRSNTKAAMVVKVVRK